MNLSQREVCESCGEYFLAPFQQLKYSCKKCEPSSQDVCTCTTTERAFLDEIREKFEISEDFENDPNYAIHIAEGHSLLWQEDFTKCNLQELVEKKG